MLAPVLENQRLRLLGGSLHPSVKRDGPTDNSAEGSGSSHSGGEKCGMIISRCSSGQRGETSCLAGGLFLFPAQRLVSREQAAQTRLFV